MKIKNYKKSNSYNYKQQRVITFNNGLIHLIWQNLDTSQENALGYFKGDDNGMFKNLVSSDSLLGSYTLTSNTSSIS